MSSTAAALPDDVQALKDIILAQRAQISAQQQRIEHLLEQFLIASSAPRPRKRPAKGSSSTKPST